MFQILLQNPFHFCVTMKPTYLKLGTLVRFFNIITLCSRERLIFPTENEIMKENYILDYRILIPRSIPVSDVGECNHLNQSCQANNR